MLPFILIAALLMNLNPIIDTLPPETIDVTDYFYDKMVQLPDGKWYVKTSSGTDSWGITICDSNGDFVSVIEYYPKEPTLLYINPYTGDKVEIDNPQPNTLYEIFDFFAEDDNISYEENVNYYSMF